MLNNPQQTQQTQRTRRNSPMSEEQAKLEAERRLQNPNLAQKFQQLMQNNQGKSYWDIAFDLAKHRGINLNQFIRPR